MIPESKFNQWLLDQVFYDMCPQRIENTAGSGTPDFNLCWKGVEFWAEAKIEAPILRPFQWAWINRRVQVGGRIIVMTRQEGAVLVHFAPFTASNHGRFMHITSPGRHMVPSGIVLRRLLADMWSIPMTF